MKKDDRRELPKTSRFDQVNFSDRRRYPAAVETLELEPEPSEVIDQRQHEPATQSPDFDGSSNPGESASDADLERVADPVVEPLLESGVEPLMEPVAEPVGRILKWIHGKDGPPWGTSPEDYDPAAVEQTLNRVGFLFGDRRYFRLGARGWENLPPAPALIVSNHSGGTTTLDAWGFMAAWYRKLGIARPLRVMAHEMVLSNRITGPFFARRGALRAGRRLALDALVKWRHDVMVMPGGDVDAWRPYKKRYEVCFGGRTGYAWLALKAGVPIVPVANDGAHQTLRVLTDGRRIATALRLPELARARIFPVHLSLPFGLTIGPWLHFPLPTTLRYRIGAPVPAPAGAEAGRDPSPAMVEEYDARVRARVQALLHDLEREELARKEGPGA